VVRETRLAPKMSVTFGPGDSDGREGAQKPSHTIATILVADVCGIILHALHVHLFDIAPVIFTNT